MSTATRMPTLFIPHGGGPWPFVDLGGFIPKAEIESLRRYFIDLPGTLGGRPKAIVIFSGHWEEPIATVMSAEKPDILYDYYGFPPESYTIEWPAPGDPALAARMAEMLWGAGFRAVADPDRGFDHGVFIPLKVSWPEADIPTLQVSLKAGLDPAEHLAMGKALAPLRDEGVLLMGSGMSYHNLRAFRDPSTPKNAEVFDAWLQETVTADAATRDQKLLAWEQAPLARHAHPREEHLIPLMVMAGAAGEDRGSIDFSGLFGGARVSGIRFG